MSRSKVEAVDCNDKRAWRQMLMDALTDLWITTRELAVILNIREGMIHSWLSLKNLPNLSSRIMIRDLLAWIYVCREHGVTQE